MKRYLSVIALSAFIALTGCASQGAGSDSETSIAIGVADKSETEIALVTGDVQPEDLTEPPRIMVQYSGDGVACASAMTIGNYTWDGSVACGADPVTTAAYGHIDATVDLDLVSDGEPKIGLRAGSEITSVKLYPLDGSDAVELEYTQDGTVKFPADVTSGVVDVSVKYAQGDADYYFTVLRSQTDNSEPPQLRVFYGGLGTAMTRGGYTWTVLYGDEAMTAVVDCPSPWQMYTANSLKTLYTEPSAELAIILPEDSRITSAVYYTGEDERHDLAYDGGKFTLPAEELSAVCCVTVEMPLGTCDYVFAFQTGSELSTPAYEPGMPSQITAEYNGETYELRQFDYKWTDGEGIEHSSAAADISSPWNVRGELEQIHAEPGSEILFDLPDGAEITDAGYSTSHDESWTMEFTGNSVTAPEEKTEAVCTVRMTTPQGWSDYSFVVNTAE